MLHNMALEMPVSENEHKHEGDLVSVIIPSYNHGKFLRQRIDSVLSQTFKNIEVIILDDASSDDSIEIIETFRNCDRVGKILYNEVNSGSPFKQWSKGISLAAGRWIWLAESDDFADPELLEKLIRVAYQYDNVGISFSNSYWIDESGNRGHDLSIYKSSFFRTGVEEIATALVKFNSIQNASSCLIRRDLALIEIRGIDRFKACGDWIFYTRILQNSNLAYCNERLNYFRWYHANTSNTAAKEGKWVSEGVKVLREIDFMKVSLSFKKMLDISKYWWRRAKSVKPDQRLMVFSEVLFFSVRFISFKAFRRHG